MSRFRGDISLSRGLCKTTKTYEGKPCKICYAKIRYQSTGQCIACVQSESRKAYQRNPKPSIERSKKRYRSNTEAHKNTCLIRLYGISLEEFKLKLQQQSNVCAICKQKCVSGRDLCVDHDHESNKVRGLLCVNCNRGIGNFRDDSDLLQKAIDYLNEYRS